MMIMMIKRRKRKMKKRLMTMFAELEYSHKSAIQTWVFTSLTLNMVEVTNFLAIYPNAAIACKHFLFFFRFSFATDIARGLLHMEASKLHHGRLKSSNVLIDDRWTAKIVGKKHAP